MKLFTFWRSMATFRVRIAKNIKSLEAEPISVDLAGAIRRGPSSRTSIRRWRFGLSSSRTGASIRSEADSLRAFDTLNARIGL